MRILICIPLLFVAVACRSTKTYRAARVAARPEAPVTVHRSIDKSVRVLDFSSKVTHDGRMSIKVRLTNGAQTASA